MIRNSDHLLHTAHAIAIENKEFNFGMQPFAEETRRFTRREVMLPIKCDIHPWMKAWVGVLDHPYFSVTSETGSYGIPNLPPGRYVFEAWHEKYMPVSREIDVPLGADIVLDFVLDVKRP